MTNGSDRSRSAARTAEAEVRSDRSRDDLGRAESVAAAIRRAFPLPESGAFADLLAALEDEPQA